MSRTYQLIREQWIPRPLEETFAFFARPQNLQQITPPWLDFRIEQVERELHTGSRIQYRLRWHGIPMRWTSEIADWSPPYRFIDNQLRGPYALWHHEHNFTAKEGGTLIRDEVRYAMPFGLLGELAHRLMARRDVEAIFAFRQQRLEELLGKYSGRTI